MGVSLIKILFILPAYSYYPEKAISEINRLFKSAHIIVINDNPTLKVKRSQKYTLVSNQNNLGLARSLEIGYSKALSLGADIIIKLDPDLEYPISSIKPILEDIKSGKIDVGFVHFYRKIRNISTLDYVFHFLFGKIESFFIGETIKQHSPGLQVYRATVIKKSLESYHSFLNKKNLRWGGDLLFLKLSKDMGFKVRGYEIKRVWLEKRNFLKIIKQGLSTIQIITAYRGIK